MFGRRQELSRRLEQIIQAFRSKGALTPETAMTAKDLGLPPRFAEAMHRRWGRSGVVVEIDGRYYLSEQRLAEVRARLEERRQGRLLN